jgi:hypothetical protein
MTYAPESACTTQLELDVLQVLRSLGAVLRGDGRIVAKVAFREGS